MLQLVDWLTEADVDVCLDGGWVWTRSLADRPHKDLVFVVLDEHTGRMREVSSRQGFAHVRGPDWNFALRDGRGREVGVNPVRFDTERTGHLTTEAREPFSHPATGFAAVGTIDGRRVKCLSVEVQMVTHSYGDYIPGDTDFHDMRLLNERLGTPLLPPYGPAAD